METATLRKLSDLTEAAQMDKMTKNSYKRRIFQNFLQEMYFQKELIDKIKCIKNISRTVKHGLKRTIFSTLSGSLHEK